MTEYQRRRRFDLVQSRRQLYTAMEGLRDEVVALANVITELPIDVLRQISSYVPKPRILANWAVGLSAQPTRSSIRRDRTASIGGRRGRTVFYRLVG